MKNIKRFVAFVIAAVMTLNVAGFNNSITGNATSTYSTPSGDLKPIEYTHVTDKELNSLCPRTKKFNSTNDRYWHKYSNTSVYNYMTPAEKEFYDNLDAACMQVLTTDIDLTYNYTPKAECSNLTYDEADNIIQLFKYQNPQYYFLSLAVYYSDNYVSLKCYPEFSNGEKRADTTDRLFNTLDSYVNQVKQTNDIEKAAHDLICKITTYKKGTYDQSMYSVIMEGNSVCAGYSMAYEAIMNAAGIQTVGTYSTTHAWNKVKTEKGWRAVDTTWDDQYKILYKWYNLSDEDIKFDDNYREHTIDYNANPYFPVAYETDKYETTTTEATTTRARITPTEAATTRIRPTTEKPATTEAPIRKPSTTEAPITNPTPVEVVTYEPSTTETPTYKPQITINTTSKLKKPTISTFKTSGKNKLQVKFKKIKNSQGMQIQLSTNSNFTGYTATYNASYNITNAASLTIKNLPSNTRFYIRARQMKTKGGKTQYSAWSKVKKATTK